MTWLARVVLILSVILACLPGVSAQTPELPATVAANTTFTSDVPNGIELSASIALTDDAVGRVDLMANVAGTDLLMLIAVAEENITITVDGIDVRAYFDSTVLSVPLGVSVDVFWRVTSPSGDVVDTSSTRIPWHDVRFTWVTHASALLTVHSYALSTSFAQEVIASALDTIVAMQAAYGTSTDRAIDIWVYASVTDFRGTLAANTRESIAGVSYPGFEVIHLVLPEGNHREVGRTVTHEVAHQVLAAQVGETGVLPLWLDEGIATRAQTEGNDGYLPLAIYAANHGKLFSLASLDGSFPFDAGDAAIAYAISWCTIAMIEERYGEASIERIIAALVDGSPVADAIQRALGATLAELDDELESWLLAQPAS